MKIAVVNGHYENYEPLAKLTTWGNRKEYCNRHGYHLHVKTDNWVMPARHPVTWDRFKFLRDVVASGIYDWVWCSGTDTFHTNMTIPLTQFIDDAFHVVASCDWISEFQADSYFVRNSPEAIAWMDEILSLYPQYKNHVWVEQQAILDTLNKYRKMVKLLPQRTINSYHYPLYWSLYPGELKVKRGLDFTGQDGQWKRGDFLIHWPSQSLEKRIQLAKVYANYVVR